MILGTTVIVGIVVIILLALKQIEINESNEIRHRRRHPIEESLTDEQVERLNEMALESGSIQ